MYKGIAGSEGIGIGNVVIIEEHEIVIENKKITDTDAEIARLQGAIEKFVNDTNAMADRMEKTVGAKDADILRGHIQMLQDPTIEEQITALIVSEKITAEKALDQVLEQTAEIFAQIPDELLQQRATDFRDIKARILKILLGIEDYDISAAPAGTVLVAHDLTPSMTAGIVQRISQEYSQRWAAEPPTQQYLQELWKSRQFSVLTESAHLSKMVTEWYSTEQAERQS